MKSLISRKYNAVTAICAALVAAVVTAPVNAQDTKVEVLTQTVNDDQNASNSSNDHQKIVIEEVDAGGVKKSKREVAWLGLAVEEASEALSSQLGLKRGEGLTVDFLAQGSPAAKASFRKNDVLVDLDGQMLVHPMQFRKLIQMHSEGDSVNLVFYRGGKKQAVSVKLGKTNWNEASNEQNLEDAAKLETLGAQLNGLNGQLRGMSQSLATAGLDKVTINANIERTMEQTRKAIRDAVANASSAAKSASDVELDLKDLAHEGVNANSDATVIVHNTHNSNRTIVQTDDSGTYIIEAGASTHLTARDRRGKALFDGEIDTPAERDKVPKQVWEKVAPIYDQMAEPGKNRSKYDDKKSGE